MALTNDQITAQNFKDFYGQIRPYLNGTAHGGFTPIGTVISVMGKQAPYNYLICNGTVYNIADYPELAAYFASQFGSSNFFGGNGTTTFAVPDLRGEFLRGAGTNSHANMGSGASVGVHQDATKHIAYYISTSNVLFRYNANGQTDIRDQDSSYNAQGGTTKNRYFPGSTENSGASTHFTSRPTNTSVLFCIATKNIFMDAGCNYSTDEQVVGTWIDGKPIYQKTFTGTTSATTSSDSVAGTIVNLDTLVNSNGTIFLAGAWGVYQHPLPYDNVTEYYIDTSNQVIIHKQNEIANSKQYMVTIQYTKTTD